jgi:hypothetical protein
MRRSRWLGLVLGCALWLGGGLPAWAVFPIVQDTATGCQASNSLTWTTVTYPPGVIANQLILLFFATDGTPTTSSVQDAESPTPNAFTQLRSLSASDARLHVWYRVADGSETDNITITLSASEQGCWRTVRISHWHGTVSTGLEAGGDATGTSANPNALSFNPANWGTEDTLWFNPMAADDGRTAVSGFPSNCPDGQFSDQSNGSQGALLGTCRAESATDALDFTAYTIDDATEAWATFAVAVRPGNAGIPPSDAVGDFEPPGRPRSFMGIGR